VSVSSSLCSRALAAALAAALHVDVIVHELDRDAMEFAARADARLVDWSHECDKPERKWFADAIGAGWNARCDLAGGFPIRRME
jgi:hypothetical protein